MNKPLFNLVSIQFKEFFREPEIIFWAIAFPIVLSWLLGIAIGTGGHVTRKVGVVGTAPVAADSVAVGDAGIPAGAPLAKGPALAFEEGAIADSTLPGGDSAIEYLPLSRDEAVLALKQGRISIFIERDHEGKKIRYYFDPRSREAQLVYLMLERERAGGAVGSKSEVVPLEVQGTRYIDFLVPGLLAMGIMGSAMWGIGWALIEVRMKKLLRRMAATPMRKTTFLGSYFVTRLIINAIEFMALFLFAFFYFGVRIQGSIPALVTVIGAGNMAFAGIAVFAASRTSNSRVGNGLINAVTFPMTLISGVFFSYHNFPAWAVPIVRRLPLTMIADSIRAIFNEGAGFAQTALPALALAAIGLVFFSAGIRIFRWY